MCCVQFAVSTRSPHHLPARAHYLAFASCDSGCLLFVTSFSVLQSLPFIIIIFAFGVREYTLCSMLVRKKENVVPKEIHICANDTVSHTKFVWSWRAHTHTHTYTHTECRGKAFMFLLWVCLHQNEAQAQNDASSRPPDRTAKSSNFTVAKFQGWSHIKVVTRAFNHFHSYASASLSLTVFRGQLSTRISRASCARVSRRMQEFAHFRNFVCALRVRSTGAFPVQAFLWRKFWANFSVSRF